MMLRYLLPLWLLLGCGPPKALTEELAISETKMFFGQVPVGSRVTETVSVTNVGQRSFSVLSASITEGSTGVWEVERQGDDDLESGDVLDIDITFIPTVLEVEEGTLLVRTTLEDYANLGVDLAGEGSLSTLDGDGDGYSPADGDCDDNDAVVYPDAEEACDGKDSDCDGEVPDDEEDGDLDGWRICAGDCDDNDGYVSPNRPEICDEKDSDCDGVIEDHLDFDQDGQTICEGDCWDESAEIWLGNPEICDELDNDCDGDADNVDNDGDGYGPCTAGGDCDDSNAAAHPVILDPDAEFDGDGSVDFPFLTFDDAVDGMDDLCRSIAMFPGTYDVRMVWDSGPIRLIGLGDDPGDVILEPGFDGDGAAIEDRIFNVSGGALLGLANLTLRGGMATGDGGAILAIGADVELDSVSMTGNSASADGGAVAVTAGELRLDGSSFSGNAAGDDGGAVAVFSGDLTDRGSTYWNNSGSKGGAILLESSSGEFEDFVIDSNSASSFGGGLHFTGSGHLQMARGSVWRNVSNLNGGGIYLVDHSNADSHVRNLLVQNNLSGVEGGGIALVGDRAGLVIANNSFSANESTGHGAGVYVESEDAESLLIWSNVFYSDDGTSAVSVPYGSGASVAYNTAFLTSSGLPYDVSNTEDDAQNLVEDPMLVSFSANGDPEDDDLSPQAGSGLLNTGPTSGEGLDSYSDWDDPDGSRNNRGHTGGPGAAQ
jgi:hypothetical protein